MMTDIDLDALVWMGKYAACFLVLILGWVFTRGMVKGFKTIRGNKSREDE